MTDRESRADDFAGYKRVARGDIVINRMRAFEGGAGISPRAGMVSSDYAVLRASERLSPEFFHYLIRSRWFVGEMTARLRGIGSADLGNVRTPRINVDDLGDIEVALPSVADQCSIADYLEHRLAEVAQVVDRTRRLDALIDERVRAAITASIVEGPLSAGAPSRRIRRVAQVNPESKVFARLEADDLVTFLPLEAVWPGDRLDISRVRRWQEVASGFTRFVEGDVLVPKITPTFEAGRAVVARGLVGGMGVGSTELNVLRPGREIDADFLASVANSTPFLEGGRASMYGVAGQQRVADGFVRDFKFALPGLDVQKRLVTELRRRLLEASEMQDLHRRRTALLLERRDGLVACAVTGQIEIPPVAA